MQGRDGVKKFLQEDREALKKLYAEVRASIGIADIPENSTNGKEVKKEEVVKKK